MFWAPLVAAFVFLAVGVFAREIWLGELALSIFPQAAGGLIAWAVLCAFCRKWAAAGVAGVLAAAPLYYLTPLFSAPAASVAQSDLTVLWANVFGRPEAFAQTMALAQKADADIVLIAEYPDEFDERPPSVADGFVHRVGRMNAQEAVIAVFSRHPIDAAELAPSVDRKGVRFFLTLEDGKRVQIAGVHPTTPMTNRQTRLRNAHLRDVFSMLDAPAPTIVVGDFNTVPWSPVLARLSETTGAARISPGWRSSWITRFPVFGLPIDHAFARGDLAASVVVGPRIGSDHLPLIVEVDLAPARALAASD